MQMTHMGLVEAALAAEQARDAPSETKGSARPGVRSQTVVVCPAETKARARAEPITQSPIMLTSAIGVRRGHPLLSRA